MAKKNYPRKPHQRAKRAARSFYATKFNQEEKERMRRACLLLGLNFREVYKDFIENVLNLRGYHLGNHVKDNYFIIIGAFPLDETPQGFNFWWKVHRMGIKWA